MISASNYAYQCMPDKLWAWITIKLSVTVSSLELQGNMISYRSQVQNLSTVSRLNFGFFVIFEKHQHT